jgi:two-component system response regulator GlrR
MLVIGDARDIARAMAFLESGPGSGTETETETGICQRGWDSVDPAALGDPDVALIVPIVGAFDADSSAFFQMLATRGARAPVLAVLPANADRVDQADAEPFACAVRAVDDFVLMPVRAEEWRQRVRRLTGSSGPADPAAAVADRLAAEIGLSQLVGRAPAFLAVLEKIPLIARSGSPALITGETGTGKELCARAIHQLSPRCHLPFIPVDCGALPDSLFENEFFGHVRGAFTDAHRDQRGLVGLAEGGTLFLDEVDSLSTVAQVKLLRFLQERTFRPLGSDRFLRANVNVLAAMNRDPESLVRDKLFRADLFFRLNVVRLHLAPLRERRADIPLLARHIVESLAADAGLGRKSLSPAVLPKLLAYDWPGNVRELHNALQRAVVLATDRHILCEHVSLPDAHACDASHEIATAPAPAGCADSGALSFRRGRSMVVEEFERSYVTRLIEKHGGNVTQAAREAQKDRRAFGRLLKKHGIRAGSHPTTG